MVSTRLKNISQWEGLSHILWKVKKSCSKPPTRYLDIIHLYIIHIRIFIIIHIIHVFYPYYQLTIHIICYLYYPIQFHIHQHYATFLHRKKPTAKAAKATGWAVALTWTTRRATRAPVACRRPRPHHKWRPQDGQFIRKM